jgi:Ras-related C3 botulinum toxin substrate 1
MYLFGGRDADNHTWEFDLTTREWTELKIKGAKPSTRYGHTWTWVGGNLAPTLLMFGGTNGKDSFNQLWSFNLSKNSWKSLVNDKKKGKNPPLTARYFHSAIVARDGLLVFGGYDDQELISKDFINIPIRVNVASMVPEEIIVKVMEQLDMLSVVRSSSVCKQWTPLANDAQVWRALVIKTLKNDKIINHKAIGKDDGNSVFQEIYSHGSPSDDENTPSEHITDLKILPVQVYRKYLKYLKVKKGITPTVLTGPNYGMEKIKVTLVGDSKVGKTIFCIRYFCRVYPTEYVPTVFDYFSVPKVHKDIPTDIAIWDVFGGVDSFDRLRPLSYPHTDLFVAMFSLVNPRDLINVKDKWLMEVHHHVPEAPIMLVGTKADLRDDPKTIQDLQSKGLAPITDERAEAFREEVGALAYMPCSTRTGFNVDKVIDTAVALVFEQFFQNDNVDKKKCVIM